jgi:hypothetical protein
MTTVLKDSSLPATGPVTLLVETRKGAWYLKGDCGRQRYWVCASPQICLMLTSGSQHYSMGRIEHVHLSRASTIPPAHVAAR